MSGYVLSAALIVAGLTGVIIAHRLAARTDPAWERLRQTYPCWCIHVLTNRPGIRMVYAPHGGCPQHTATSEKQAREMAGANVTPDWRWLLEHNRATDEADGERKGRA